MIGFELGDHRLGVGPSQGQHLGGEPFPDPPQGRRARLGQQLAAIPADLESQEVTALIFEVDHAGLVLVEGQTPGCQPRGQPRLDLLRLLPRVAQREQVVGINDQDRRARCRGRGIATQTRVTDSGSLFHAMQGNVQ
jgi:hypothetical protein